MSIRILAIFVSVSIILIYQKSNFNIQIPSFLAYCSFYTGNKRLNLLPLFLFNLNKKIHFSICYKAVEKQWNISCLIFKFVLAVAFL